MRQDRYRTRLAEDTLRMLSGRPLPLLQCLTSFSLSGRSGLVAAARRNKRAIQRLEREHVNCCQRYQCSDKVCAFHFACFLFVPPHKRFDRFYSLLKSKMSPTAFHRD